MTKKGTCLGVIFTILMSGLIFILGFDRETFENYPIEVYQVYLDGKIIGVVENKDELYSLIDKEQESLKKEYDVDNIYPPEGLELVSVNTYNTSINTVEEIYDKIKDMENFTIDGYEITIKTDEESESFYILHEEDLETAIDNTIKAFIDEETLEMYRSNSQPEIVDEGEIIKDIYIKENITIKETYIPSDEEIFTNSNDLTRYLLFGTMENQKTYTVMPGDTVIDISNKNSLNPIEFLIANPDIVSEYQLLFPGTEVNIGLIDPKISVVVERIVTSIQEVAFTTDVEYDEKMTVGTTYTKQQGINGESKATFQIESINGEDTSATRISSETIKPAVDAIIVKGGLSINYAGDSEYWAWPTIQPYVITSRLGWRWGSYHNGVDIAGTGHGSPIYSIQSGVVISMGYNSSMGNYVYIDHQNGYISVYMHLAFHQEGLKKGSTVLKGQQIGGMGTTGRSTGTHLHLSVWVGGYPYSSGAEIINPLDLYNMD